MGQASLASYTPLPIWNRPHTNIWNRHLGNRFNFGIRSVADAARPGSPLLRSAVNVAVRIAGRDQSKFGFLRVAIRMGRGSPDET